MRRLSGLSIKHRLIVSMFLAVLLSTSIVGIVGQSQTQQLLTDRLESSDFPNLLQRVRNSVDGEIKEMQVVTHAIATNPMINEWSKAGADSEGEKVLVSYLAELARTNNLSNASYADRETNNYWNQDGFLRQLQDDSLDGWFFAFKSSGKARDASTYTYEDGSIDVFVNYQQINGRGASGVSKSFDGIVEYLNSFKIEKTGYVFLIDSNGLVKVHNNRDYAETETLNDLYPDVDARSLLNREPFSFQKADGLIIATSYVESLGWYVVAQVPESELYASLNAARNYMIVTLLISAVAFSLISIILANNLVKPINRMAAAFEELDKGDGDLTVRVNEDEAEEVARLAAGFNGFISKIHEIVKQVSESAGYLNIASEGIYGEAQELKGIADKQRDESHQVSVAMNEMGSTISDIANNANVAAQASSDANHVAKSTHKTVAESSQTIQNMANNMLVVSDRIETLAQKSESISSVLDVIRGIADQTNLLALNAAIEAARAGEQGRGFAVVADEVRNLAQRTSQSTDEIHEMITQLQEGAKGAVSSVHEGQEFANQSVEASERTGSALDEIVNHIQQVADLNTQIATATEEQSLVVNEINQHVLTISDTTETSFQSSSNVEQSTDQLNQFTAKLNSLVAKFKL